MSGVRTTQSAVVDWDINDHTGAIGTVDRLIVVVTFDHDVTEAWRYDVIDPMNPYDVVNGIDKRTVMHAFADDRDFAVNAAVEDALDYLNAS